MMYGDPGIVIGGIIGLGVLLLSLLWFHYYGGDE